MRKDDRIHGGLRYNTGKKREQRRDETRRDERVWLIGEGFTENLIEIAMKRRGGQIVIYMHSPDTPSKCELIITRQDSTEESRFQLVISRSWSRWLAGSNVEFFSCFWGWYIGTLRLGEFNIFFFLFSFIRYLIDKLTSLIFFNLFLDL